MPQCTIYLDNMFTEFVEKNKLSAKREACYISSQFKGHLLLIDCDKAYADAQTDQRNRKMGGLIRYACMPTIIDIVLPAKLEHKSVEIALSVISYWRTEQPYSISKLAEFVGETVLKLLVSDEEAKMSCQQTPCRCVILNPCIVACDEFRLPGQHCALSSFSEKFKENSAAAMKEIKLQNYNVIINDHEDIRRGEQDSELYQTVDKLHKNFDKTKDKKDGGDSAHSCHSRGSEDCQDGVTQTGLKLQIEDAVRISKKTTVNYGIPKVEDAKSLKLERIISPNRRAETQKLEHINNFWWLLTNWVPRDQRPPPRRPQTEPIPIANPTGARLRLLMRHRNFRMASMVHLASLIKVLEMSEAGLYLDEAADEFRCHRCSLVVPRPQWPQEERPADVHRRLSPGCPVVNPAASVDRRNAGAANGGQEEKRQVASRRERDVDRRDDSSPSDRVGERKESSSQSGTELQRRDSEPQTEREVQVRGTISERERSVQKSGAESPSEREQQSRATESQMSRKVQRTDAEAQMIREEQSRATESQMSREVQRTDAESQMSREVQRTDAEAQMIREVQRTDAEAQMIREVQRTDAEPQMSIEVQRTDAEAQMIREFQRTDAEAQMSIEVQRADAESQMSREVQRTDAESQMSIEVQRTDAESQMSREVQRTDAESQTEKETQGTDTDALNKTETKGRQTAAAESRDAESGDCTYGTEEEQSTWCSPVKQQGEEVSTHKKDGEQRVTMPTSLKDTEETQHDTFQTVEERNSVVVQEEGRHPVTTIAARDDRRDAAPFSVKDTEAKPDASSFTQTREDEHEYFSVKAAAKPTDSTIKQGKKEQKDSISLKHVAEQSTEPTSAKDEEEPEVSASAKEEKGAGYAAVKIEKDQTNSASENDGKETKTGYVGEREAEIKQEEERAEEEEGGQQQEQKLQEERCPSFVNDFEDDVREYHSTTNGERDREGRWLPTAPSQGRRTGAFCDNTTGELRGAGLERYLHHRVDPIINNKSKQQEKFCHKASVFRQQNLPATDLEADCEEQDSPHLTINNSSSDIPS